jgi:hypothetical protein
MPPRTSAPDRLSPAQIAALLGPAGNQQILTGAELERLVNHLTDEQLDELVVRMGLGELAQALPPIVNKVIRAAERMARSRSTPPDYEDEIIQNLAVVDIQSGTYCNFYILMIR